MNKLGSIRNIAKYNYTSTSVISSFIAMAGFQAYEEYTKYIKKSINPPMLMNFSYKKIDENNVETNIKIGDRYTTKVFLTLATSYAGGLFGSIILFNILNRIDFPTQTFEYKSETIKKN